MNTSKLASYSDLLTDVDLRNLEHRRYSPSPTLFYKCLYNMGPNYIKEMFLFRNNGYDLRGFLSLIILPITVDLCIGHIITSPQDYGTI